MFYTFLTITILLLLSLWGFFLILHPIKLTQSHTPRDFGIPYETVQFKTNDNLLISGWFIPSKKPHAKTIILLHGYPADKSDILPSRLFLHDQYNLLLFDFRGLGESQGKYSTLGKYEVLDLQAAIHYLQQRGIKEVGVWGFSLGAAVVLLQAAKSPEIKAIVAEAPFARLDWMAYDYYKIPGIRYVLGFLLRFWGWLFLNIDISTIRPVQAVKDLDVPLLIIYYKKDTVVGYDHALLMEKMIENHAQTELIIIDSNHGGMMGDYKAKIQAFFAKYLH